MSGPGPPALEELPGAIRALLPRVHRVWPVTIGESGDRTSRLETDRGDLFLKVSHSSATRDLWQEIAVLERYAGQPLFPELLGSHRAEGVAVLLTRATPGRNLAELSPVAEAAAAAAGHALRALHDQTPASGCPFDQRIERRLSLARRLVALGEVDETHFEEIRRGRRAAELLEEVVRTRPEEPAVDLVFTHGDYCLPNILFRGLEVTGLVDWGRAGLADRHHDLALFLRSLSQNRGTEDLHAVFLAAYGAPAPDPARIEYFQLLDEIC